MMAILAKHKTWCALLWRRGGGYCNCGVASAAAVKEAQLGGSNGD